MEQRKWKWTDAHFCSLPSQTTIYGCTKIINDHRVHGSNKLLVAASLVGQFFTVEYQRIFDKLTPSTKEIHFTYIPGDSEIVSIDATTMCLHGDRLTIGITFWKQEDTECKQFLHIYSAAQQGEEFNLESVAQGWQSLELGFMPFHLTHTDIVKGDTHETVFMLSGSDNKVHMYREVNDEHSFKEGETGEHFPELANLPSVVMWLDIRYYDNSKRRITVTGHQDGLLLVSIVTVETLEVEHKYHVEFDNPITYAVTFTITNSVPKPANISTHDDSESTLVPRRPELNILVLSALVPGTIYRDVLKRGLRDHIFLPDSNKFDAILTGCVIDIDFDGENEILIGTYGQEVLAYKLSATKPHRLRKSSSNPENTINLTTSLPEAQLRRFAEKTDYVKTQKLDLDSRLFRSQEDIPSSVTSDSDFLPLSPSKNTMIPNSHYLPRVQSTRSSPSKDVTGETSCWLLWQRSFPYPVMGINCLDIMGDGMEDLVIVTLKGLHILQPDLGEVANVVLDRLRLLGDQLEARDSESYYGPDSFDGVEERPTQFPFEMPAKEHKSASLHN